MRFESSGTSAIASQIILEDKEPETRARPVRRLNANPNANPNSSSTGNGTGGPLQLDRSSASPARPAAATTNVDSITSTTTTITTSASARRAEPSEQTSDVSRRQVATRAAASRSARDPHGPLMEEGHQELGQQKLRPERAPEQAQIVWLNVFLFVLLHSCLPVMAYQLYHQRPWLTLAYTVLMGYLSGLGVTAGSHRLWSHRAYKASAPVEWLLMGLQTMAGQNSIYTWSRDHRLHHKFSETDADPHNIKRGFFFAHMGWLMLRKHSQVKEKGKLIDMSDLDANQVVSFQHRHFWWLSVLFNVCLPTALPVLLWGESLAVAFNFAFMFRYLLVLHATWCVNSAAHYFGHRPYDRHIEARESPMLIFTGLGEGFHNYHHTFPYDYATGEFGRFMNLTTCFIDLCARLGLVHDRRKVEPAVLIKRRQRTGDLAPPDNAPARPTDQRASQPAC